MCAGDNLFCGSFFISKKQLFEPQIALLKIICPTLMVTYMCPENWCDLNFTVLVSPYVSILLWPGPEQQPHFASKFLLHCNIRSDAVFTVKHAARVFCLLISLSLLADSSICL